ncbi:MAG TPA: Uma2 family endonuclease, partial [Tepidisphaeraceae bacterium]|nr:Uma2 family endonuclease [Tepidisphaeraceae bacterium]
ITERLIAERKASGLDAHDEVWDGVYFMPPIANNEHQSFLGRMVVVFGNLVTLKGLGEVVPGANVSDRDDWTSNYRVPDMLVFLNGNPSVNKVTHWRGGPDLAVEIVSPRDRSREKLAFYAAVGTREVLLIDRDPWQLELYRLSGDEMVEVGRSSLQASESVASAVVPVSLRMIPGAQRPQIEVTSLVTRESLTI